MSNIPSSPPFLSHRIRKNLRRWAKGGPWIKCREVAELQELGLIERVSGPMAGGGYVSTLTVSEAGREVLRGKSTNGKQS